MAKIVTMGELLVRLSTHNNERFIQAQNLKICYGGSEANVAVSLAMLGHDVKYVTKLPDSPIGQAAVMELKKYGVDTSHITYGGSRMGIYYLEIGSSMRTSNVVYDRAGSSISEASTDDFDFDEIFKDADWFHFSGITPAISEQARKLTLEALKSAKKNGVTISCDINYRKKLWSLDKAHEVMSELMNYVDVCIGGREDAVKVLGFELSKRNEDDTPNLEAYEKMFKEMKERYDFKYVVCSVRRSHTSSYNELSGLIYDGEKLYQGVNYKIEPMVDRVGGGDAFAAGIVDGLIGNRQPQEVVDFAVAASVLKHTIPGDYNLSTRSEVENLLEGKGAGKVKR